MPIDEAGALAAIDAGIAEAAPSTPAPEPEPEPEPQPTGGDDNAEPTGTGADAPVDAAGQSPDPEGAGDPAPAGDEPEPAEGQPADGTPPDGGADGDPAAAAADAAAKAPAEGDGKPVTPPDPLDRALNDPIPNALKRETKERIQTLAGKVRELIPALETAKQQNREILGAIQETGASPEQFGQALDYLRMVNSPSVADREQAFAFLQQELAAMARMLGKPIPGVNMLEGHQDLIDELATGRITPERAQEIAAAREARKFDQQRSQATTEHQRAQQRQQQAIDAGRQALNNLGRQLKGRDGAAYDAKRAVLVKTLSPVFARIPPEHWAETFRRAYDELPAPVAASATPAPRPPGGPPPRVPANGGGNTPLRATNPAGGAVQAPKSPLEALEMGLAAAR